MILNKDGEEEIREYIEKELESVEGDICIKLDKELLETLLFKTIAGITYPAWTGEFLRKIDLSEICFNNVCFDAKRIEELYKMCGIDKSIIFDFSYTNAKIDFTRIRGQHISNCCFKGMNLLDSNISFIVEMSNCDFTDSKVKFTYGREIFKPILENCNFVNCDMSECYFDYYALGNNNIFINTNLKVTIDKTDKEQMKKIGIKIKSGNLNGCYLNDKYILSKEQQETQRRCKNTLYDSFKMDIKEKIHKQINEQVTEQREKQKKKA